MVFLPREEGQGLVEYALILILVAMAVVGVLAVFGRDIEQVYENVVKMFQ